ncbi:MAG: hypothetical protein LIP06_12225 [Tannerellaceae bacterium]|nr:hypothetical protein [Tannerellaceae bacterium]
MKKLLLFVFTIPFYVLLSGAPHPTIHFITNNDGLSNSSINYILQDAGGLMWFGTWDGLNLYNSREFTTFRPNPADPHSISNHVIRYMVEEERGGLWIATDYGISRYHADTRDFQNFFTTTSAKTIYKEKSFLLAKNSQQAVFAYVYDQGLYYFSREQDDFLLLATSREIPSLKAMFFDKEDKLWIYTTGKELRILSFPDPEDKLPITIREMQPFEHAPLAEQVYYNPYRHELLIQNKDRSVYRKDILTGDAVALMERQQEEIQAVFFTPSSCYIGSSGTLYAYDYTTQELNSLLTGYPVLSLYKDKQDILWAGTDGYGVLKLTNTREKFHTHLSREIDGFENGPVRCFFEDAYRDLWIGTKGGGLYRLTNQEKPVIKTKYKTDHELISNSVYALSGYPGQEIWIGTEGKGLNYFDQLTHQLYTLRMDEGMNLISVYAIYQQNDTTLWVGTSGYGLYKLHIDRSRHPYRVTSHTQYIYDKQSPYSINNNVIYSILPDGDEHLWVCTRGGLNRLHIGKERFESYRFATEDPGSISSDDILCLMKDRNNRIWVGTSMGLNLMNDSGDGKVTFIRYTEKEGIANNTIHGILQDYTGQLWISTNKGLSQIDPATEKIIS